MTTQRDKFLDKLITDATEWHTFRTGGEPETIKEHLVDTVGCLEADLIILSKYNKKVWTLTSDEIKTVYCSVVQNLLDTFADCYDHAPEQHGIKFRQPTEMQCKFYNCNENNRFSIEFSRITNSIRQDVIEQIENGIVNVIVREDLFGDHINHYIYRCDFAVDEHSFFYIGRTNSTIVRWSQHVRTAQRHVRNGARVSYFHSQLSKSIAKDFERVTDRTYAESDLSQLFSVIDEVKGKEASVVRELDWIGRTSCRNRRIGGCNSG